MAFVANILAGAANWFSDVFSSTGTQATAITSEVDTGPQRQDSSSSSTNNAVAYPVTAYNPFSFIGDLHVLSLGQRAGGHFLPLYATTIPPGAGSYFSLARWRTVLRDRARNLVLYFPDGTRIARIPANDWARAPPRRHRSDWIETAVRHRILGPLIGSFGVLAIAALIAKIVQHVVQRSHACSH
ncbi:hypothetical protein CPB84DRAFT_1845234 [Gymnopilus junonius]|uniref:Uncharacterized protein n=1 Tax=Gymnopilus junonius TaxID=109634 RepID=A0A9P5NT97_GYMJU|nr:hypothetical protein CPB84DRAFT_1845234 [Gymnopilus junonius]